MFSLTQTATSNTFNSNEVFSLHLNVDSSKTTAITVDFVLLFNSLNLKSAILNIQSIRLPSVTLPHLISFYNDEHYCFAEAMANLSTADWPSSIKADTV